MTVVIAIQIKGRKKLRGWRFLKKKKITEGLSDSVGVIYAVN